MYDDAKGAFMRWLTYHTLSCCVLIVAIGRCPVAIGADDAHPTKELLGKRCGFLSMATVMGTLHVPVDYRILESAIPDHPEGSSLQELAVAATQLGLACEKVRVPDALPRIVTGRTCAILPIQSPQGEKHFVVLVATEPTRLAIVDYPNGLFFVEESTLRSKRGWDGNALLIAKNPADVAAMMKSPMGVWFWLVIAGVSTTSAGVLVFRHWRRQHAAPT